MEEYKRKLVEFREDEEEMIDGNVQEAEKVLKKDWRERGIEEN